MILIKEQWYDVRDLDDVVKLIRKEFNYDLADKIEELVDELKSDHESDMRDLQDECDSYENECDNKDDRISILEDDIESLQDEIKDEDTVYILGDISWHKVEKTCDILSKLRGIKFLVKGNHDSIDKSMKRYFKDIYDYKEININGQNIVLCHYPIPCFKNHYSGSIHLYGHTHNTWEEDIMRETRKIIEKHTPCNLFNVGCMFWNYEPVSLDEIIRGDK